MSGAEVGKPRASDAVPWVQDRWPDLRFVFVVAYARSGSTLVQSLLNSCPGVQIRGENSHALYHLSQSIAEVRHARHVHSGTGAAGVDTPWFGADLMRPRLYETAVLQAFVKRVLAPDPGIKVSGFKEIRYGPAFIPRDKFAPYMDFLLAQFPGARIVFNSRRAEDVARSGFMARQGSGQVQTWVAETDARFAQYAAGSDRATHLRYEDYVADHSLIHGMLDFLDLDWTADRVEAVFAKPLSHARGSA